jgi:hypothetical protein
LFAGAAERRQQERDEDRDDADDDQQLNEGETSAPAEYRRCRGPLALIRGERESGGHWGGSLRYERLLRNKKCERK